MGVVTQALRFIVTYRWELLLLLGAPFAGNVASMAVFPLAGFLYAQGWLSARFTLFGFEGVGGLVEAGLLLAFYARVCRLERTFLSLVWGYAILIAAVGGVISLVAAAFRPEFGSSGVLAYALWSGGSSLVYGAAVLLLLLRFARRASLLSLAHAYFLFLVVKSYLLTAPLARTLNPQLPDLVTVGVLFTIGFVSVFGGGALLAWLLGNFGSRGAAFRKRAVTGLLALYIVSELWELVEWVTLVSDWSEGLFTVAALTSIGWFPMRFLVFTVLPLALIYLVRVRDLSSRQPPTDLRVQ